MSMHYACLFVCVYLKSNSLDMFLDIHDVCVCMIVQMQHIAAHTLSTKHGGRGRRGQICNNCAYAYLMDTCVALQHLHVPNLCCFCTD